jgi:hypothetical protein
MQYKVIFVGGPHNNEDFAIEFPEWCPLEDVPE